ncbi:MAG: hypothetical protein ACTSR2_06715 [Candidatus Hodarchaeales archaeon]
MSPRKSLGGFGESRRMIFRVDREVEDILSKVKNKSLFIRESIIYYWKKHGNDSYSEEYLRKRQITSSHQSNDDINEEIKKKSEEDSEAPTNRVWSPPWKRD